MVSVDDLYTYSTIYILCSLDSLQCWSPTGLPALLAAIPSNCILTQIYTRVNDAIATATISCAYFRDSRNDTVTLFTCREFHIVYLSVRPSVPVFSPIPSITRAGRKTRRARIWLCVKYGNSRRIYIIYRCRYVVYVTKTVCANNAHFRISNTERDQFRIKKSRYSL